MITQKHDLDVTPSGVLPVVNASQYDVGRIIKFYLYNESEVYNIPVGTSVLVNGIKPNGDAFSYSATYTDNEVTVTLTDQMTVIDGEVKCELRFADALGNDIGTTNFILLVERAPFDASIPISETEIPAIIELARAEQYNAEAWAVGERNGIPVDPTDPTYHNNAKYWSENAQHGSLDNLSDVAISSPVGGQALVYDDVNDEWVNGNVSTVDTLDDLTDVSLVSPTNGQVLTFNNNEWKNESIGVDDLDDIVITNPANDDGFVYDSTSQKWENVPIMTKEQWKNNGAYNHLPFPYSETSQVRDGTTFVVASNGKITVSGVPSNPPDFSYLRLVSVADSMAFASTYAGTSVKFCLCSSSATGLSLKVEGLDASNNTVFTQTGIQEGTVINIPSSVVKWEVLLVVANTFSGASTIVTPMLTTDLNATYDDYVPYAKTNSELTEKTKLIGSKIIDGITLQQTTLNAATISSGKYVVISAASGNDYAFGILHENDGWKVHWIYQPQNGCVSVSTSNGDITIAALTKYLILCAQF